MILPLLTKVLPISEVASVNGESEDFEEDKHNSSSFRPLSQFDFPFLQQWLLEPHVVAGWNESADIISIRAQYIPRIDGIESQVVACI